jgi:hypothetical protein
MATGPRGDCHERGAIVMEVEERLDRLELRMDRVEQRLDRVIAVMERGFDTLADLQRDTNQRLDTLTEEMRNMSLRFDNFVSGVHQRDHADLRRRVERIERHLHIPDTDD